VINNALRFSKKAQTGERREFTSRKTMNLQSRSWRKRKK